MSTVKSKKIQLGSDATASNNFTIYQPDSPDGTLRIGVGNADSPTEVGRFDSNGLNKLGTATGDAPSYSARAWVNFNGSGTVSIRASGNVSSITDNGTGLYAVNLTTAMPDTNYSVSGACANQTTPTTERDREFQAVASSTSVVNINIFVQTDMAYISLQVFR